MKNKFVRGIVLTTALSSMISITAYAQSIKPISSEFIPISYKYSHWAESYLDKLSVNYDVVNIFEDKNLDSYITVEDFNNAIRSTIDESYENLTVSLTRESIIYECAKIWAGKTNKDLDSMPVIRMMIYSDTSDINVNYLNGIYIAYMYDIAKGREEGVFDPKANVTYGELAVLIINTINAIEEELTSQEPVKTGEYETKGTYEIKDDKVIFHFEFISHHTEPQELMFGSGQQFELVITNEEGEEVYRFSDGKSFTMAIINKTLNPGQSMKWQDEWDMTDKEGNKLSRGNYKAEITVLVIPEEGNEIDGDHLKTVLEFTLNG